MTKLTKVRKSKLQIDRLSLDCPATSGHGMAAYPGWSAAVHREVLHCTACQGWKSSYKQLEP